MERIDLTRTESTFLRATVAIVCAAMPFLTEGSEPIESEERRACIDAGLAGTDLEGLIADAVRVLIQAGHDPASYRMELHTERPTVETLPGLRWNLLTSVVFVPREENSLYAVRVHPDNPCVVSWVWRPERFSDWQREVIEKSQEILKEVGGATSFGHPMEIEVLETAEVVSVHIWNVDEEGPSTSSADFYVALNKADLSLVETPDER
jgi:hypothetical protein